MEWIVDLRAAQQRLREVVGVSDPPSERTQDPKAETSSDQTLARDDSKAEAAVDFDGAEGTAVAIPDWARDYLAPEIAQPLLVDWTQLSEIQVRFVRGWFTEQVPVSPIDLHQCGGYSATQYVSERMKRWVQVVVDCAVFDSDTWLTLRMEVRAWKDLYMRLQVQGVNGHLRVAPNRPSSKHVAAFLLCAYTVDAVRHRVDEKRRPDWTQGKLWQYWSDAFTPLWQATTPKYAEDEVHGFDERWFGPKLWDVIDQTLASVMIPRRSGSA